MLLAGMACTILPLGVSWEQWRELLGCARCVLACSWLLLCSAMQPSAAFFFEVAWKSCHEKTHTAHNASFSHYRFSPKSPERFGPLCSRIPQSQRQDIRRQPNASVPTRRALGSPQTFRPHIQVEQHFRCPPPPLSNAGCSRAGKSVHLRDSSPVSASPTDNAVFFKRAAVSPPMGDPHYSQVTQPSLAATKPSSPAPSTFSPKPTRPCRPTPVDSVLSCSCWLRRYLRCGSGSGAARLPRHRTHC